KEERTHERELKGCSCPQEGIFGEKNRDLVAFWLKMEMTSESEGPFYITKPDEGGFCNRFPKETFFDFSSLRKFLTKSNFLRVFNAHYLSYQQCFILIDN
ncbi:MAG: hypothetical protein KGZ39_00840, partial [Simkania sp.]|nr:hypothetical protein [Simkania sp.]